MIVMCSRTEVTGCLHRKGGCFGETEFSCPGLGGVFGPVQDGSVVQTFQAEFWGRMWERGLEGNCV